MEEYKLIRSQPSASHYDIDPYIITAEFLLRLTHTPHILLTSPHPSGPENIPSPKGTVTAMERLITHTVNTLLLPQIEASDWTNHYSIISKYTFGYIAQPLVFSGRSWFRWFSTPRHSDTAEQTIHDLAELLGDARYFLGSASPGRVDALVYGCIRAILLRDWSSLHSVVKSHRNLLRWADTIHNQMFSHYQTTVDWNGNIYAVEAKSEEKADDVHKE